MKGIWKGTANWIISWLYTFLKAEILACNGTQPLVLFIQFDNCAKDNKNKYVAQLYTFFNSTRYMLSFLALLIRFHWFMEIYCCFLPVGHTHTEDVDGMFGKIGQRKKFDDFGTLVCCLFFLIFIISIVDFKNQEEFVLNIIPKSFHISPPSVTVQQELYIYDWKSYFEDRILDLQNMTKWRAFKICKNDLDNTVHFFYKSSVIDTSPWRGLEGNTDGEGFFLFELLSFYFFLGIQLVLRFSTINEFPLFIPPLELPEEDFVDIPSFFPYFSETAKHWWTREMDHLHSPPLTCTTGFIISFTYFFT